MHLARSPALATESYHKIQTFRSVLFNNAGQLAQSLEDIDWSQLLIMAVNYWTLFGVATVTAIVLFGIPFVLAEYFPWRNLWKQRVGRPTVNTESYKGRTALITGANGAFGSRAARIFAHREVETLVLVDVKDCADLKEQIEAEVAAENKVKPNILVWQVDMMSYAGCQALGQKASELKTLDHVLMTMGILSFNRRESPEGWETCKSMLYSQSPFSQMTLT